MSVRISQRLDEAILYGEKVEYRQLGNGVVETTIPVSTALLNHLLKGEKYVD